MEASYCQKDREQPLFKGKCAMSGCRMMMSKSPSIYIWHIPFSNNWLPIPDSVPGRNERYGWDSHFVRSRGMQNISISALSWYDEMLNAMLICLSPLPCCFASALFTFAWIVLLKLATQTFLIWVTLQFGFTWMLGFAAIIEEWNALFSCKHNHCW